MPEHILKYQIPEEQDEFELAINGNKWYGCMWDLDQELRNWLKHGHDFKSVDEALEKIRSDIYDMMKERNLFFGY